MTIHVQASWYVEKVGVIVEDATNTHGNMCLKPLWESWEDVAAYNIH